LTTENETKPEDKKDDKPETPKETGDKGATATKGALECVVEDLASIKKHLGLDVKKGDEPKPPPQSTPDPKPLSRGELLVDKWINSLTDWMF
jgi:hypothetical protein